MHKYPQKQSYVASIGQTLTTNVSMTLCSWQICHQTHVSCRCTTLVANQIRYQTNMVPRPAAYTGGGGGGPTLCAGRQTVMHKRPTAHWDPTLWELPPQPLPKGLKAHRDPDKWERPHQTVAGPRISGGRYPPESLWHTQLHFSSQRGEAAHCPHCRTSVIKLSSNPPSGAPTDWVSVQQRAFQAPPELLLIVACRGGHHCTTALQPPRGATKATRFYSQPPKPATHSQYGILILITDRNRNSVVWTRPSLCEKRVAYPVSQWIL